MAHYRDSRTSHIVQDTDADYDSVINLHLRATVSGEKCFFFFQDALKKCIEENKTHEISSVEEAREHSCRGKMLQRVKYVFT